MIARRTGRQGFTLAEMIAAVALLAIFSVFIVQMYVKADQVSRKARLLDKAVACASNLADQWKMNGTDGVPDEIMALRQGLSDGKSAAISLDEELKVCDAQDAVYAAVLTLEDEDHSVGKPGGLWKLKLVIGYARPCDSGPIYTLQAARYFPEEVAVP